MINNIFQKQEFENQLSNFAAELKSYCMSKDGQWSIKGFIDIYQNIYTISADTKIISKILEIHLFPKILEFAHKNNYSIIPTSHQNYYPDITFVCNNNVKVKFAVDFKTTYKLPSKQNYCNGFTLGSHGEYFINRASTKNIQFPYSDYSGHFCFGIIYERGDTQNISETKTFNLTSINNITSVISKLDFFITEKWKIASDKRGSGNTANIGSINFIPDLIKGLGIFSNLGENIFDDYWINYGKITTTDFSTGKTSTIKNLHDFLIYRGLDPTLIRFKNRVNKK